MLKFLLVITIVLSICISGWVLAQNQSQSQPQSPSVNDLELVKNLTGKLDIKPEQAAGAAGSIFGFAKTKLSAEDFGKVSNSVPGMDQLLKAAPVMDSKTSGLSQLAGNSSGLASLTGSFQKLGLSPDMVGKAVPEVLSFVQAKGGDSTKNILSSVLK